MKTLLTSKENFANMENVYNEDYTTITTIGEPRGKMKQIQTDWIDETDYVLLKMALKILGLDEYIEIELVENKLYLRIYELEEDKRLEESGIELSL